MPRMTKQQIRDVTDEHFSYYVDGDDCAISDAMVNRALRTQARIDALSEEQRAYLREGSEDVASIAERKAARRRQAEATIRAAHAVIVDKSHVPDLTPLTKADWEGREAATGEMIAAAHRAVVAIMGDEASDDWMREHVEDEG